jgi:hypothetical protein
MSSGTILQNPRSFSRVADTRASHWLTTADVARMLAVTVHGARWLARTGQLPYEATASGQRLFQLRDVVRLLEQRGKGRLTGVPVVRATDPAGPRQLSLFGKARLRIVATPRST